MPTKKIVTVKLVPFLDNNIYEYYLAEICYLFISGLLNNMLSSSDYLSPDMIIMNLPGGIEKIYNNLSQDTWSLCQNLNLRPL
jgi:hypothetical protein